MLYHDAAHGAAGAEADGEADKLILEKVEMPGMAAPVNEIDTD